MKLKCWLAIFTIVLLTGCNMFRYSREHEVSAELPRALGLGAFAPSCLMFCYARADFTGGDVTGAEAEVEHSKLESKSRVEIRK